MLRRGHLSQMYFTHSFLDHYCVSSLDLKFKKKIVRVYCMNNSICRIVMDNHIHTTLKE